jgi:glycosyltransferase involved in cell wall biosynthesis
MSSSPLISIIMNCYNCERFLPESIESVYAQSYKNWEIIFWDNCSTDASKSIAFSHDDKIKYYSSDKTLPLGEARNLALSKVSGKYIAFLDCDDVYLPEKLQEQVSLMESSNFALTYGSAVIIDEMGRTVRNQKVKNRSGMNFGALLNHYEINMQTVMLRREILGQENLKFEEKLKYCPDYNLFMEIASRHPVGVIDGLLVKYRLVKNSLSDKTVDIASAEIRFTLDQIFERDPGLMIRYKKESESAYAKLHYYDAVAAMYRMDRALARRELASVIFSRWEYFMLYLILFLPVPCKLILRLVGR